MPALSAVIQAILTSMWKYRWGQERTGQVVTSLSTTPKSGTTIGSDSADEKPIGKVVWAYLSVPASSPSLVSCLL